MQYSHILWDFNGTLLDDVGLGLECINLLLASRSLPPVPHRDAYRRHFRFPIRDYYASVGFDFSKDPYDILAHEWIDLYRAREDTCPLYDGVVELLEYIRSGGTPQILFSATQREMLLAAVYIGIIGRAGAAEPRQHDLDGQDPFKHLDLHLIRLSPVKGGDDFGNESG